MSHLEEISTDKIHFSDFVKEKIRVWFKMMDTTKDGFMAKEDFELIANRFAVQYNLDEDRAKEIYGWLVDGFKKVDNEHSGDVMPLVTQMAEAIKNGAKISEDEYIGAIGQLMTVDPLMARNSLKSAVTLFFQIFDFDKDGFITCDELEKGLACFGYDNKEVIDKVFECMVKDHVGKMSQDEYVNAWLDFIFGEDKDNPFVKYFAPHLL
ncbi:sarcoplasmic calcium-binding protein-like [Octopus vulgaris]|uniref:Sarcoplasmic calcium-binding protein-like n=1 Tax=Octopus vulgaris TaxID=6645 RepID=A0AA36BBA8_OCTVU|nr:sarcoplasmic calcium-binding protein-like [Octopus vulgaris]